ncbi:MAG: TetR/AcrR family transcriptional regulator [Caldiserica bacterium]|nr:TetR/AcrR family transcriptional regulator [Caldisericota bacterium]
MSPRSEEANIQIKDDRQKQILCSALKVFIHKGFAAAKMSDIATEAGISYGLMYHYFQSKEEIYAELVKGAIEASKQALEKAQKEETEPIDKIRALIVRIFASVGQHESAGYYFVLMMGAMTSGAYPALSMEGPQGPGRPFEMLVRIIEDGQRKGQIMQGSPAELATTFFSAILGLASLKVSGTIASMPDPGVLMRIFQPASQAKTK